LQLYHSAQACHHQSTLGRKVSPTDRQLSRLAEIPQREHNNCFSIVRVGGLPAKCIDQPGNGIDLTEFSREKEAVAIGWLHRDPIATSDPQVEFDARSRKSLGTPPLSQQLRLGMHPEHQR